MTNFEGVDVVALQGAMVWGDDQLWGSGRGAIAGCHCSVLWFGGRATTNFGGVDVVPLLGAVVVCYGGGGDDQLWGSGRGAFDNTRIGFLLSRVYAGIIFKVDTEII